MSGERDVHHGDVEHQHQLRRREHAQPPSADSRGRLLTSFALDLTTWRWSLEIAALVSLAFTAMFLREAPASVYFRPQRIGIRTTSRHVLGHLCRPSLLATFGTAFLLMGGFVSFYNIIEFRLLREPFGLPQSLVGLVFLMYLSGAESSAVAERLASAHRAEASSLYLSPTTPAVRSSVRSSGWRSAGPAGRGRSSTSAPCMPWPWSWRSPCGPGVRSPEWIGYHRGHEYDCADLPLVAAVTGGR